MTRLLIDHLWQSTLFGLAIWSIALGLRTFVTAFERSGSYSSSIIACIIALLEPSVAG